jgi:hypothetical protein
VQSEALPKVVLTPARASSRNFHFESRFRLASTPGGWQNVKFVPGFESKALPTETDQFRLALVQMHSKITFFRLEVPGLAEALTELWEMVVCLSQRRDDGHQPHMLIYKPFRQNSVDLTV